MNSNFGITFIKRQTNSQCVKNLEEETVLEQQLRDFLRKFTGKS